MIRKNCRGVIMLNAFRIINAAPPSRAEPLLAPILPRERAERPARARTETFLTMVPVRAATCVTKISGALCR